ncbi:uncharacterized protein VP01_2333g3, partial [Puccinia sorghi]
MNCGKENHQISLGFNFLAVATPSSELEDDSEPPPILVRPSTLQGYAYVPHYDHTPKNITSSIDPGNIIEGSQRHKAFTGAEPIQHKGRKNCSMLMQ